ncbi:MAG: chemotaxis protein CheA [bacterium]|nr:chemotaxis protein CheA [bacterium]MDD5354517.1 chemotaxis protein CheA [bacterium]MDD5756442.1 chemotaxis protein CheA [bacterium]
MTEDMSRYKDMFISEATEYLQNLNKSLLALEKNPDNLELLNEIFRLAHTMKGMAATMGYQKITTVAHQMEDVLDRLRKQELKVTPEIIETLFKSLDVLEPLLQEVASGEDKKVDITEIIVKLKMIMEQKKPDAGEPAKEAEPGTAESEKKTVNSEKEKKRAQTSVRINIEHLDNLMNLVGELVINKARLFQIGTNYKLGELNETLTQLDRITGSLQEEVLKTRMIPVSHIFDRYPRVVRDLAKLKNKEINFEIEGSEIELDRMIVDEINDPLIHLIRNSVDHGIETPQERVKKGKSEAGYVKLSARREKGYVRIELTDDGKGMDPNEIAQKAIEKGMVAKEKLALMTEQEMLMLICEPGFSTASEISDISGRGVGMDVVKTKIEAFNGSVTIETKKGKGSTFIIKLPLTLAIIQSLMVKVADEVYAIPLSNITEINSFAPDLIRTIEKKEVVKIREEILPLVSLREVFNLPKREYGEEIYVVTVEVGEKRMGLVVDSLYSREEIVIKTLSGILKRTKGISGATILGDGRVVLIVDIAGII